MGNGSQAPGATDGRSTGSLCCGSNNGDGSSTGNLCCGPNRGDGSSTGNLCCGPNHGDGSSTGNLCCGPKHGFRTRDGFCVYPVSCSRRAPLCGLRPSPPPAMCAPASTPMYVSYQPPRWFQGRQQGRLSSP